MDKVFSPARPVSQPVLGAELEPCPFCGGEASGTGRITYDERHRAWWKDGSRVRDAYHVNCIKCGVSNAGLLGHQTPADAHAAWNRRTPPQTGDERSSRVGDSDNKPPAKMEGRE